MVRKRPHTPWIMVVAKIALALQWSSALVFSTPLYEGLRHQTAERTRLYSDCLKNVNGDKHLNKCVPLTRPENCSEEAWIQLYQEFGFWKSPDWKNAVLPWNVLTRNKRAPPPAYLSIEGWQECLGVKNGQRCRYLQKPENCRTESFDQLANDPLFSQPEDVCEREHLDEPKPGPPPGWPGFQVRGWEDCIGEERQRGWCLLHAKPQNCDINAFYRLQQLLPNLNYECKRKSFQLQDFDASQGAPEYLNLGQDILNACLGNEETDGGSDQVCMLRSRPRECSRKNYRKLKNTFSGSFCKDLPPKLGRKKRALPPAYLSVRGFRDCVGAQNGQLCLLSAKASNCDINSYYELYDVFTGDVCTKEQFQLSTEVRVGAPAYLEIDNFKACLGSETPDGASSSRYCMLKQQPTKCEKDEWEQMKVKFTGEFCKELPPKIPPPQPVLPPAYLSVNGWEDCLGSQSGQLCLLSAKASNCEIDSYYKLHDVFTGEVCTKEQFQLSTEVRVGAPAYLDIDNFKACLGSETSDSGSFSRYCMLKQRPTRCQESEWEEMKVKYSGKFCEDIPPFIPTIVGRKKRALPPAYLSVNGWEDCLGSQNGQLCLLSAKASNCDINSYYDLYDVFTGDVCTKEQFQLSTEVRVGAPAYLDIDNFKACLGSETSDSGSFSRYCMLRQKPTECKIDEWEEMKVKYSGKFCQDLPPRVGRKKREHSLALEDFPVNDWIGCLKTFDSSIIGENACLPLVQPEECSEEAFFQLQKLFFKNSG